MNAARPRGQGSGVVVGEYEVVTNCHVLDKASDVAVRQAADWAGGETYRMAASLLARNEERDLCLLLVEELPLPPAARAVRLGAAKALSVGEEVYAVGAPAGLELSLSRGIVSQLRGAFGKRSAPLVQTDAAISPGSSGGGLFNQAGELVGVTTSKWRGENLNFALPAEWVEALRAQGRSKLIEAKRRAECLKNPTYECVIDLALHAANSSTVVGVTFRSESVPNNPIYRCERLLDIAATQTRVGDIRGAKQTLSAAFEAAREIRIPNRFFKHSKLAKIAVTQTKIGDEQAAKQTLAVLREAVRNEISDPSAEFRRSALHEFAVALAKTGNIAKALEIANSIIDSRNDLVRRSLALIHVVEPEHMRDLVEGMYFFHSRALSDIAEAQAEAGDVANAMRTATSIGGHWRDGDHYRGVTLAGIAAVQAQASDFSGSMKTAMSFDNAKFRAEVLTFIAQSQLANGHVEAAEQTLALVSFPDEDIRALLCIIQAKKGNFTAALAIADSFDDPGSIGLPVALLSEIAVMQARTGDPQGTKRTLEAARETALGADKAQWIAETLSDVAVAQAKAGDLQGTAQTFAEALEIHRMVDDDLFLRTSRAYIAENQAEAGFFADAVKNALKIDDTRIHIEALMSIAHHLSGRPPLPWWGPRKRL